MVVRDRLSQEALKRFSTESKASTSACIDSLPILCCKRKASSYNLHALLYPISLRFGLQCTMYYVGEGKRFSFQWFGVFFKGEQLPLDQTDLGFDTGGTLYF